MDKPIYNLVSFSGGKDSTAMLLGMIERGMQIDCILFCDTGLEFPDMYEHIDRVEKDIGRPITRIKAEQSFEYLMFEHPVKRKNNAAFIEKFGTDYNGYGWAGPRLRWCTSRLKDMPRERFLRPLREKYTVIECVGIATDEQYRLERPNNKPLNHKHPLVEWGMTEADCLRYCKEHGYDWNGLYDHFHRVSCWCCPLQSLDELRQLYKHYPELWEKLKSWDKRTWRDFKENYSVDGLEARFLFEEECIKHGKPIKGKEFYTELRKRLERFQNEQNNYK